MEFRDVRRALRSGWLFVVGGLLAGVAIAWWLASSATPMYSSTSRLLLWTATEDPARAVDAALMSQQRANTYAEMLTGRTIAGQVVDDLDLDVDPAELAESIDVVIVPESLILEVTVTDPSPEQARDVVQALGDRLVLAVEDLDASSGNPFASPIAVEVIEPPLVDDEPVSPSLPRYVALGGALGLIAGLVIALLRHRADTTVKDRDDVTGSTGGGAVLGTVLADRRLSGRGPVLGPLGSLNSEAFSAIATGLQLPDAHRRPRAVAVAGAVAGEGRTTLALNLAAALARSGRRVVLVETDHARPRLASALDLDDQGGLLAVLAGSAGWREVAQPWTAQSWGDGGVTVLPAGSAPDTGTSLDLGKLRALVAELREAHDVVLVDTAPLLAVAEAAAISALVDGCILTARYGLTRREQLAEAAATLARSDVRLLGVVLNGVPRGVAKRAGYAFAARRAGRPVREGRPAGPAPQPSDGRTSFPPSRSPLRTKGGAT
jgi:receptor protein-tyrosine kinase